MRDTAPDSFRSQFPALTDTVHLASCSQGAASLRLIAAMQEFQWSMRSYGAPWDRWMAKVETAREMFADLIGATADEIAVVSCASEGAYQVASTIDWRSRPVIVSTDLEFPSIAHVWLAQGRRDARVRFVPARDGLVSAKDYAAAIDETAGLVSVPLVSYRGGIRLPAAPVVAAAHAAGARVFMDAYQAVGVLPVDVRALGCDYLVAGALKYLLGVPGIAFLYVRAGLTDDLSPALTGWFGRSNPFAFDPRTLDFPPTARRFETGTPAIPAAYGAVAGLTALAATDITAIDEHVRWLGGLAHKRLAEAGERIFSPGDPELRGPQVAIVDDDPGALAAFLADRRIVTSPRGDLLRLSFHYYNNEADVTGACDAIRDFRTAGRPSRRR
jgi:selenocysteine lyase/cysteine desulfurase